MDTSLIQTFSLHTPSLPPSSITQTQHGALSSLKLPHLFAALRLFVDWAEDGWYDFCSLPFAAKSPLTLVDEETISQISDKFDGEKSRFYQLILQIL